MFKPVRILVLVLVSVLVTTGLYALDTDPPTDDLSQSAAMAAIIFVVITILYAAGYGLSRTLFRRAGA